ncbi:MAG: hypothetical protein GY703_12130 [Gammaproteobacteria bacterium]|nr:hypothetical protein [Gammaproteobacteria bacterium]
MVKSTQIVPKRVLLEYTKPPSVLRVVDTRDFVPRGVFITNKILPLWPADPIIAAHRTFDKTVSILLPAIVDVQLKRSGHFREGDVVGMEWGSCVAWIQEHGLQLRASQLDLAHGGFNGG